jgi:hypothetical protein
MQGLVDAADVVGGVMIDTGGVPLPYEHHVVRRVNVCIVRVGVV